MSFVTLEYPTDPDVLGSRIQDLLSSHFTNTSRKTADQHGVARIELEWNETVAGEERWYRAVVSVPAAEDFTDELADMELEWRDRQREYEDYDEQGLDNMEDRFGGELP